MNEDDNYFNEQFNDINYKIKVKKLHGAGFKSVILLMLMFLCLVMDVVCLGILNFMIKS